MIRFSDIQGNPVMDTTTATAAGKVAAPVVDPITQRVVGFRIKRSKGPGDVLMWDALSGIGPDAITVQLAAKITDAPPEYERRADKGLDLLGRRVLTENGRELGVVRDIEFDPADGRVSTLLLKNEYIDGERLMGIGDWAVVVRG